MFYRAVEILRQKFTILTRSRSIGGSINSRANPKSKGKEANVDSKPKSLIPAIEGGERKYLNFDSRTGGYHKLSKLAEFRSPLTPCCDGENSSY